MLYENKCVFCDFLQKMAFFANYKKTRNFQKVHPSFYCSPWSPLSKKLGWICPQEMHTKCQLGPRVNDKLYKAEESQANCAKKQTLDALIS